VPETSVQRVEATVHAAEITLHPVRRPWARTTGLLAVSRCHRRRRVRTVLARPPLIDIDNAVNERLDLIYADSSLGERLQHALPDTRVVKTLNTVGGPIGVQPGLLPSPTDVFLSGDDTEAKAVVASLLGEFGWTAEHRIDLGAIATARAAAHYFLLFAALMGACGNPAFNISITR